MTDKKRVAKKPSSPVVSRKSKPSQDPESRERQLVNLAVDLAEKQLMEGTASPSVLNHFLKIASKREILERDILEKQAELIKSKAQNISKDRDAEDLAKAAIEAMRSYKAEQ